MRNLKLGTVPIVQVATCQTYAILGEIEPVVMLKLWNFFVQPQIFTAVCSPMNLYCCFSRSFLVVLSIFVEEAYAN